MKYFTKSTLWSLKCISSRYVWLILFVLFWFTAPTIASPGHLDTSFNGNGKVITSIANDDHASGVAVQADGKIVVVGSSFISSANHFVVVRYNSDGSLDQTFGTGGIVATPVGNSDANAIKVAIQADGKIVVAGIAFNGTNQDFAVLRYNTNGSFDSTFGNLGRVITPLGNGEDRAFDLAIQGDGKIVVVGSMYNGLNLDTALVRYNTNGSLDTTFGNQGIVITDLGGDQIATAVTIQVDGKIVVAIAFSGSASSVIAAMRYNPDGSRDLNFGNGGVASALSAPPFSTSNIMGARGITLQDDGKILVSGNTSDSGGRPESVIVRFTTGGSPDSTFATGGVRRFFTGHDFNAAYAVRQVRGKIVAAGTLAPQGRSSDFMAVRFKENGQFDNSFGIGGIVVTPITPGNTDDFGMDMEIQADGKIVVIGYTSNGTGSDIAVVRYMGGESGNITRSLFDFDGDGQSDIAIFRPSDGNWWVRKSSDATTFVQNFGLNGDLITPGDYDGDGKTDFAVFRPSSGIWYLQQSTAGFAALQWGLNGDRPVPGDYDSDGRTDIAVWRPSDGNWYVLKSSDGQPLIVHFGLGGDVPALGDYDGDCKSDIAVWRPSDGNWYVLRSSDSSVQVQHFGLSGDLITPGDYDNDGKTDLAVFRPSNGTWYLQQSTAGFAALQWGLNGDRPVPGDYDSDGRTDIAVWRPSDGIWYIVQSSNSQQLYAQFGTNGDVPIPTAYIP